MQECGHFSAVTHTFKFVFLLKSLFSNTFLLASLIISLIAVISEPPLPHPLTLQHLSLLPGTSTLVIAPRYFIQHLSLLPGTSTLVIAPRYFNTCHCSQVLQHLSLLPGTSTLVIAPRYFNTCHCSQVLQHLSLLPGTSTPFLAETFAVTYLGPSGFAASLGLSLLHVAAASSAQTALVQACTYIQHCVPPSNSPLLVSSLVHEDFEQSWRLYTPCLISNHCNVCKHQLECRLPSQSSSTPSAAFIVEMIAEAVGTLVYISLFGRKLPWATGCTCYNGLQEFHAYAVLCFARHASVTEYLSPRIVGRQRCGYIQFGLLCPTTLGGWVYLGGTHA